MDGEGALKGEHGETNLFYFYSVILVGFFALKLVCACFSHLKE